jgi:hypothetical protein
LSNLKKEKSPPKTLNLVKIATSNNRPHPKPTPQSSFHNPSSQPYYRSTHVTTNLSQNPAASFPISQQNSTISFQRSAPSGSAIMQNYSTLTPQIFPK